MFIREKKILIYIYIYTSAYTHIQQTRSNALSSLSLALAPRIVCRSDGRRRLPPSALSPLFSPSFLPFFFFFPDKFRVFKSHALSRHVFSLGLAGRPILLYFSRATRTHNTHTNKKMQSMIAQRASAFARAPRMTRQVRKKRDSNISLFISV